MGTIILHVGMPKAGSSSIQHWLGEHAEWLRDQGMHPVRVVKSARDSPIEVVPSTNGRGKSLLFPALMHAAYRVAGAQRLVEALDACARRDGTIILSNEGYELLLQVEDSRLRSELDSLADVHVVRIVYYVRPQHTWLDAAWRQWGFRHTDKPSQWLARQEPRLRYLRTLQAVRSEAPRLAFDMRPFRGDLLEGRDVVTDFGKGVLGLDTVPPLRRNDGWSNRGFPLELAILLRDAPPGLFWSSLHDNATIDRIKQGVLEWQVSESPSIEASRAVLQSYCFDVYEPDNRVLIEQCGWDTRNFVPPVETAVDVGGDLAKLDDLWCSSASESERQLIFRAIEQMVVEAG